MQEIEFLRSTFTKNNNNNLQIYLGALQRQNYQVNLGVYA